MKKIKSYIAGAMALLAAALGTVSCQDSFDAYKEEAPVATIKPNTTIAELKAKFWNESSNYCDSVGTKENGEHYIISGRVISSDYAGNCFKYIVIQDETGALNFSINSYNLYLNYRRGQEVVVDMTGLYVGKYRGLFQVGFPKFNTSINGDETSFMAPEFFARNAQLNGWPEPAKVDTLVVNSFAELGTTPADLQKWQSQIVRFNNVEFVPNATLGTLSTYQSSGETQQIRDAAGNTLDIRTSGYANFWNTKLPTQRGDVVALMGYYINLANAGGWQLTLIDAASLMNFGNPTIPEGMQGNPYSVDKAIALQVNDQNRSGWVKGYMVGTVAPEVTEVKSNSDIDWGINPLPTTNTTLVIGADSTTTDIKNCLIVTLPAGSDLRKYGALRENPDNFRKAITIKGTFAPVLGSYGITDNSGAASEFSIEGKTIEGGGGATQGDGTEANPFSCAQVIAMNPSSTTEAVQTGVWTSGYIVGYYFNYDAVFGAGSDQPANILLSDVPNPTDKSQCVCVQLVASSETRNALNLKDNPGKLGAKVAVMGDIMKYNTLPGVKNTSAYKLLSEGTGGGTGGGETGGGNIPEGNGTEASPMNCAQIITLNPQSTTEATQSGVWAKGYIVGFYANYTANFTATGAQAANVLLADVPNPTDKAQCICIQLVANTEARAAINLLDNPGNLGKKVQVLGDVMKYNTLPGIKNTTSFKLDTTGGGGGGTGGGGDVNPGGAATVAATALSVTEPTTVDGYTFTFSKGTGATAPAAHAGTSAIRLYANNTAQITGGTMTKIVFTLASDAGFRYTTVTASTGTIAPQAAGDTSFTWTGNASDVTFTVGAYATLGSDGESKPGQIRFTTITIN